MLFRVTVKGVRCNTRCCRQHRTHFFCWISLHLYPYENIISLQHVPLAYYLKTTLNSLNGSNYSNENKLYCNHPTVASFEITTVDWLIHASEVFM